MSVVVCWCDGGEVDGPFAESIMGLVAVGALNGVVTGWFRLGSGPVLDKARNDMTERFLATTADWMLMVDSDMVFRPDLLERLLEVADPEERPIVGPLCYGMNHNGPWPVIYSLKDHHFYPIPNPPADDLLRVDAMGAGCLLIHRSALEKMASKSDWPGRWWDHLYLDDQPVGEDLAFCLRARAVGLPLFVHTGLRIGHLKEKIKVDREAFVAYRAAHRFVITGTGRCGTAYLAALFRQVQVPCGHEMIYTPQGPQPWYTHQGDSSWMAAPYLSEFREVHPGGTVIHLLRNPLAVANSLLGIHFFDPAVDHGAYREYALRHLRLPLEDLDEVERVATFIVVWNNRIAGQADLTVKLEDLTPDRLRDLLAHLGIEVSPFYVEREFAKVATNLNARPRASMTWADMPPYLATHAATLGYEVL